MIRACPMALLILASCAIRAAGPQIGKGCTTEPNGDKAWNPSSYPEGQHIQFDSWAAVCRAGKWTTDKDSQRAIDERTMQRGRLLNAAQTRLLAPEELKRLMGYGSQIFIPEYGAYRQQDIDRADRKFSDLLQFQILLALSERR